MEEEPRKLASIESLEARLPTRIGNIERSKILLFVSAVIYGAGFSVLTVLRCYALKTCAWDLGIFTQSFWTISNAGKFFYHTCELFINPCGFSFEGHFSPISFLAVPFYWILQTSETLLVIHAFILALAAVPTFKLANEYDLWQDSSLLFSIAYRIYPRASIAILTPAFKNRKFVLYSVISSSFRGSELLRDRKSTY